MDKKLHFTEPGRKPGPKYVVVPNMFVANLFGVVASEPLTVKLKPGCDVPFGFNVKILYVAPLDINVFILTQNPTE